MKKKIINILLIAFILMQFKLPVEAANYEMKELIPVDIKTTIVTNKFSYKDFFYNVKKDNQAKKNTIIFEGIKNISDESLPITISIGLFDKDKLNIGTINYCTKTDTDTDSDNNTDTKTDNKILASKEEIKYEIEVTKEYLISGKSVKDIKYISVLSDNLNCRTSGSLDYVGQTVEEIGMPKNTQLDNDTTFALKILGFTGVLIVVIFLYKFMYTTSYQNMDGEDVRIGYKKYNKQLKEEREYELRVNPPQPKEPIKVKTDEVLAQEEIENSKDKPDTDLQNLYK